MLQSGSHSTEFGNQKQSADVSHLCYGLPSNMHCLVHPYAISLVAYYIYRHAYALFVCIRIFPQTLPMLVPQCFREIVQPYYTSLNCDLTRGKLDDRLISLKGQEGRCEMTVAVACNLPDGVVLGVDSAVTLSNDKGEVVKTYEHAVKLLQLGEKPIGVATYGAGALGNRIIGSYMLEFEREDPKQVVTKNATVKDIVEQLRLFFLKRYRNTVVPEMEARTGKKFKNIPDKDRPVLGLAVGGFSAGAYLSEVWEIRIPFHEGVHSATLWCKEGEFRPVWFALNEPIFRYEKGYDRDLVGELKKYFAQLRGSPLTGAEDKAITDILDQYEYRIPFGGMPMEEGVAYVKFVVEMVINHHRFATGAPVVGGNAQIGLVTYKGEKFQILKGG